MLSAVIKITYVKRLFTFVTQLMKTKKTNLQDDRFVTGMMGNIYSKIIYHYFLF